MFLSLEFLILNKINKNKEGFYKMILHKNVIFDMKRFCD